MKDASADDEMNSMRELYSKYKVMESSLNQTRATLKAKIPEIQKCLEMIAFLKGKAAASEPVETQFQLADNVYANATVKKPQTVCLWLGAKVMMEYTLDEASTVLATNLEAATKTLADVLNDLSFLKDQQTITEVNLARVYNHDVKMRRKAAAEAAAKK